LSLERKEEKGNKKTTNFKLAGGYSSRIKVCKSQKDGRESDVKAAL